MTEVTETSTRGAACSVQACTVEISDKDAKRSSSSHLSYCDRWLALAGPHLASLRPEVKLKLGLEVKGKGQLTKTMINNVRKLSRSLVGIYYQLEIKLKRFGGRSSVGGTLGDK